MLTGVPGERDLLDHLQVGRAAAPVDPARFGEAITVPVPVSLLDLILRLFAAPDAEEFIPLDEIDLQRLREHRDRGAADYLDGRFGSGPLLKERRLAVFAVWRNEWFLFGLNEPRVQGNLSPPGRRNPG